MRDKTMPQGSHARDARSGALRASASTAWCRTTAAAVGFLLVGGGLIGAGGLLAALLASPDAPAIGILVAIRLAGIGILSVGVGLLPAPGRSFRRGLFAHSALATLYFCSLMLASTLTSGSWPAGWIVVAAALHGAIMAATTADWLRQRSAERLKSARAH